MLSKKNSLMWCALGAVALGACSGAVSTTDFSNPQFDFSYVERVAVLPFENLSNDRQAGVRTTRLLITELLASGAVEVVEPGDVQAALDRIPGGGIPPSNQQIISLGKTLNVQAIIVGNVTESQILRSGNITYPVVTLDVRMLETETGKAVWAGTHTEKGGNWGAQFLGTGGTPISATTRKCVQAILESMVG